MKIIICDLCKNPVRRFGELVYHTKINGRRFSIRADNSEIEFKGPSVLDLNRSAHLCNKCFAKVLSQAVKDKGA